jgi:hypothetical protein
MTKFKMSMLGVLYALRKPWYHLKGKPRVVLAVQEPEQPGTPPPEPFAYTYIIYGIFVEGENPLWYWCDENAMVESPPVLADGYDGTTALRDGLAVVVSGVFYQ